MKNILTLFLSVFLLISSGLAKGDEGHKIKIQVDGVKNAECILAYHFGNKKYVRDTIDLNRNGKGVIKGDEPIPGGIYMFVLPGKHGYFEFVVDEQEFTLKTDTAHLVKNMEVKGSEENDVFFDYIMFLNRYKSQIQGLQQQLKSASAADKENIREKINNIQSKIRNKKNEIVENHPNLFYAKVLETMEDPEYPSIKKENGEVDSFKSFMVYKRRSLNNVDWSDDRLLRTPVYHNKMTTYLNKLTAKNPDSVIQAAEQLISRTDGNYETFKYIVHHITSKYERSKIMGMDKVFVHMAEKYYLSGKADWMSKKQLKEIKKRVLRIKPNLIGKQAPRITMNSVTGEQVSLYSIEEPVTVLFFWDSDCGHCKDAIPKLREVYNEYHEKGMEVYAVNIENKSKGWKKFVGNHEMPWINVQDQKNRSRFRAYYNIYSTPLIYVLDEDKKIKAKRIGVKQLKDIVPRLLDENGKSGTGSNADENKSGKG